MNREKGFDIPLFLSLLGLMLFGLLMIFSSTLYNAYKTGNPYSFFKVQLLAEIIGLGLLFVIVVFIPYEMFLAFGRIRTLRRIVLIIGAGVMFLLKIPSIAVTAGGATRWIKLGPVNVQPAELVKIAVIIYMAGFISEDPERINTPKGYIQALIPPVILAGLVYKISDNLSSALIIMGIAMVMLFVSSKHWLWQVLVYGGGALGLIQAALFYVNHTDSEKMDFRFKRILIWQHPETDASDRGFQTVQALYAIGSGGIQGKGIGMGVQKLGVIPEVHNDMIFSVVCEELGLFGAIVLLGLFFVLLTRCMFVAQHARHSYGKLLVIGIMMQIAIQVILNIMVVTNTMPNTGVSLPFISYGGSSAVFLLIEMGIVLKVAGEENA